MDEKEKIQQDDVSLSLEELDSIIDNADEISEEDKSPEESEIEQYGVWVKVKPEDVTDKTASEETEMNNFELSDLDLDEGSKLTEEEEQLLGELENSNENTENQVEPDLDLPDLDIDNLEDIELPEEETDNPSVENLSLGGEKETLEIPDDNLPDIESTETLPSADIDLEEPKLTEESSENSEELPELDLENIEPEDLDQEEIEVPLNDTTPSEEHFDDLNALESDLASTQADSAAGDTNKSALPAESNEMLTKIEKVIS